MKDEDFTHITFFHSFLLNFIKKKNHCIVVDVNRKHAHYKEFKQKANKIRFLIHFKPEKKSIYMSFPYFETNELWKERCINLLIENNILICYLTLFKTLKKEKRNWWKNIAKLKITVTSSQRINLTFKNISLS